MNSARTQHRSTGWGVAMTWATLFWREYVLNNFDVSRQLAERREACLLRLLPRQRVRGGPQHEEKFLLTSGGRAAVQAGHSGSNLGSNIAHSKKMLLTWHEVNEMW